jgi:hypothetical protein
MNTKGELPRRAAAKHIEPVTTQPNKNVGAQVEYAGEEANNRVVAGGKGVATRYL